MLIPPPDKSISHRALLGALLALGTTTVVGCSRALDVEATRRAIAALGAAVRVVDGTTLEIRGVGPTGVVEPDEVIDVGNSGTLARLVLGVATLVPGMVVVTGDASVRRRPMDRVVLPLRALGATIRARWGDRRLPAVVVGSRIRGGVQTLPVPSAQVKSALLLAGLGASEPLTVVEPVPTRPHTEELLETLGLRVERATLPEGQHMVRLTPGTPRTPGTVRVLGDPSAAAFFVAAAAATPGARLEVRGLYLGPTRTGFVEVLRRMGGEIELLGHETLVVRGSSLRGTTVGASEVPSLIDEVPALAVAFALARGESRLSGAEELRVKESDRIETTAAMLRAFGATVTTTHDGLTVHSGAGRSRGTLTVDSGADHRIAMSAAVLACALGQAARVQGAEWIATSYPGFLDDLVRLCAVEAEMVEGR